MVTGIQPRIEKPRFLSVNVLDAFRAIYLLNIELVGHVGGRGGGEVRGPRRRGGHVPSGSGSFTKFINDVLYRDGKGFFPVAASAGEASAV